MEGDYVAPYKEDKWPLTRQHMDGRAKLMLELNYKMLIEIIRSEGYKVKLR